MRRLPSVTVGRLRTLPTWRAAAAAGAVLLAAVTVFGQRGDSIGPAAPQSLALTLAPSGLAARVPHTWLAAAPPRLAPGDRLDVIGSRIGERSGAANIVVDARVIEVDGDAFVLELAADDAVALALARANAYLLFALLRPRR